MWATRLPNLGWIWDEFEELRSQGVSQEGVLGCVDLAIIYRAGHDPVDCRVGVIYKCVGEEGQGGEGLALC